MTIPLLGQTRSFSSNSTSTKHLHVQNRSASTAFFAFSTVSRCRCQVCQKWITRETTAVVDAPGNRAVGKIHVGPGQAAVHPLCAAWKCIGACFVGSWPSEVTQAMLFEYDETRDYKAGNGLVLLSLSLELLQPATQQVHTRGSSNQLMLHGANGTSSQQAQTSYYASSNSNSNSFAAPRPVAQQLNMAPSIRTQGFGGGGGVFCAGGVTSIMGLVDNVQSAKKVYDGVKFVNDVFDGRTGPADNDFADQVGDKLEWVGDQASEVLGDIGEGAADALSGVVEIVGEAVNAVAECTIM